jgi:uncharacterized protein YbjT (DUF2867 family)
MTTPSGPVLLTGATGYIGGRLLHRLVAGDRTVHCLTRRPELVAARVRPPTQIIAGDLLDPDSLDVAMDGVQDAYYLVHSMGGAGEFADLDRRAATNFAAAATKAGLERIVYLGGLGNGGDLSPHLASRQEVGAILRASGVPTIELRASIVIGSGSASFEAVRALVDALPVIPAPPSVETGAQPIAIEDVVEYLLAALHLEPATSRVFEIGGCDRVSYAEVMREYARQRGLRRRVLPLSLVSSRASRLFLGLLTPVYGPIAAAMVDSLRNETVVESGLAREVFAIRPRGLAEAIERALVNEDHEFAETRWCDALTPAPPTSHWGGLAVGRRMVATRAVRVSCSPHEAFAPIRRLGGRTGWYALDWFWRLRGFLDTLRGGVGLRRGRRDAEHLRVGDTIDFWRVERLEPERRLLLVAEMKIPGRLWLQFEVEPDGQGSLVRQTTVFDPAGYIGLVYWYALYPVHSRVFSATLQGIRAATLRELRGRRRRRIEDRADAIERLAWVARREAVQRAVNRYSGGRKS